MKILKNGFTLVELLIVISIIAILTVITVSQFETASRKGRDSQRKSDISNLAKALEMYYADYGIFPTSLSGKISVNGTSSINWGGEFADASGYVYMKILPTEKQTDKSYCYATTADRKKMGVFSILENTKDSDYNSMRSFGYKCAGAVYNFGILSPNANIDDFPFGPPPASPMEP